MVRCEEKEKSGGGCLFGELSSRGRTKEKVNKG